MTNGEEILNREGKIPLGNITVYFRGSRESQILGGMSLACYEKLLEVIQNSSLVTVHNRSGTTKEIIKSHAMMVEDISHLTWDHIEDMEDPNKKSSIQSGRKINLKGVKDDS